MHMRFPAMVLALSLFGAGHAAAQQATGSSGQVMLPAGGTGAAIEWIGLPLTASDGSVIGTVSAVDTDGAGAVTGVRVRVGGGGPLGLGTREMTIPMARIVLQDSDRLVSEVTVEEIRAALGTNG